MKKDANRDTLDAEELKEIDFLELSLKTKEEVKLDTFGVDLLCLKEDAS